ncbi:MAG: hypothetical protein A2Y00_07035 [Omnitrophica WOR_2 bacterium GWF2_43_52]|nr:MAG: hypothetical protein A2Y06_05160 [Omnitrophica WOR_2 bacterium GWA2_37_7]OGX20176.1 MAG: hypothetical protein A2Y00_07035 [Omnitrophica WOR_2 bacterium GWF2_43_52]
MQVTHSFPPYTFAGTEVYAYALAVELSKRHRVSVVFRVNQPHEKEYALSVNNRGDFATYSINRTFNTCDSFGQTYDDHIVSAIGGRLLDEVNPDVVHIQHLLFLSIGIIKEAWKRRIPVVFTLNDYWLMCHKGQLIKNDFKVCQGYTIDGCRVCLEAQLSITKYSIFFYNLLRRHLPVQLTQFVKSLYILFARKTFLSQRKSSTLILKRYASMQAITSRIDYFVAPSQFIKKKFIAFGFPQEKIFFFSYGIKHRSVSPGDKTYSPNLRIGYIGTLIPTKGVSILISAFRKIIKKNIRLSIYGKLAPYAGYEAYYRQIIKSARDERIAFMGQFDNSKIFDILRSIDILVVPSLWLENSPLVIHEAFISKTPVIASRIGGIPELICDGMNGLLFNPGDADDLSEKIKQVMENPEILACMRRNMPAIKSIEENAMEMLEVYKKASMNCGTV